jgi:hypothetical protein
VGPEGSLRERLEQDVDAVLTAWANGTPVPRSLPSPDAATRARRAGLVLTRQMTRYMLPESDYQ